MKSPLPKVLHPIGGLPMIFHLLDRLRESVPGASIAVVVGHAREKVEEAIRGEKRFAEMDIHFVHQAEQKGTGHAARCAMDSEWGARVSARKLPVLVLPGDLPLIPTVLLTQMLEPLPSSAALRLLTCELSEPKGYGRVVRRGKQGPVLRIVEEKDANERERAITEVAASIYLFNPVFLRACLGKLSNKNVQGEYYLTDLLGMAARAKKRIDVLCWSQAEDLRGVNDLWELAVAHRLLAERIVQDWARAGVRFIDPWSVQIDPTVVLEEEVVVHPGVQLSAGTRVGRGTVLGPQVNLRSTRVGPGANLKQGTVAENAVIGAECQVGPYAHLRPEAEIGDRAKIGNFVEIKKARIGEATSIAHLSYVGDAEIGRRVNIGCGFVTCNFDGRVIQGSRKHKTVIEDDAFIGSDCQAVAPVRVGKGAFVASGSTITEDVEADALAIARARQVSKPGYGRKLRAGPGGGA